MKHTLTPVMAAALWLLAAPAQALDCALGNPPANPSAIYTVDGDTVTDQRTGLMWSRCLGGQNPATCAGTAASMDWATALGAAVQATLGGHGDWRVPNVKELRTLLEYCRIAPAINDDIFQNQAHGSGVGVWTGTPEGDDKAWAVDFADGTQAAALRTSAAYALRLVRGGTHGVALSLLPQWSGVALAGTPTANTAAVSATSTQGGRAYWLLLARGSTAPTPAQVKTPGAYTAATAIRSGSADLTDKQAALSFTGLSAGTAYDVYLLAESTLGHLGSAAAKLAFSTGAAAACGSAAAPPLQTQGPAADLCQTGTASQVNGGNTHWQWSCTTAPADAPAACEASRGYTVATSAGANGSIGAAQTVGYGGTPAITVTPATGYVVDAVNSTCGGSLAGGVFTTAQVMADCSVSATFKLAPVNGQCGSAHGGTALLASAPAASLCSAGTATSVAGGTSAWTWGCTGANSGTDAACQAPRGYTVSTSAGANGSIGAAQTVAYNGTASITVTPATGYAVDTVTGCGGILAGSTFITAQVTADCSVNATFKAAPPVLTVPEGPQTGQPITLTPPAANGWQVSSASAQTAASVGAALPQGVTLPYGVVNLRLALGTPGSTATVVLTYPEALPPGTVYYKYGPTKDKAAAHWYPFSGARIAGNTITLTLTDGEDGDDDLAPNQSITDPGGPARVAAPASAQAIPTLGAWSVLLLSLLAVLPGLRGLREKSASKP